jgi:hypothetical protein
MRGAKLVDTRLKLADLSRARVSGRQLAVVRSLKGATMPDGSLLQ